MPAPVALSPTTHIPSKAAGSKPSRTPLRSKKTRIVRRRGRAKDGLGSDDEIEREVGTDSESDDDQSSVESASDSDTEPASEDVLPNGHSRVLTPSLTQTSGDVVSDSHGLSATKVSVNGDHSAFFGGTVGNWSEMVADENVNGPADLPVIDFADFKGHSDQRQPRKSKPPKGPSVAKKQLAVAVSPLSTAVALLTDVPDKEEPVASTSREPSAPVQKRAPGQTARQAYQQRLEKDPSYVPTVGEFWGHDDRLLDKDLRSLSGWWRGRWQGRGGRGRGGFDRGSVRGRGRGGFVGGHPNYQPSQEPEGSQDVPVPEPAHPIERAWTHDGFEEMKRRDENRRQLHSAPPSRGGNGFRGGRGEFGSPARGRGGFTRGGFNRSASQPNSPLPSTPPASRTWFAMKPERIWTKQHDGFLHVDTTPKPRSGQSQSIHIKLPGVSTEAVMVNLIPDGLKPLGSKLTVRSRADEGEKTFVVRFPKRTGKEKETEKSTTEESVTTVNLPPVEDTVIVIPRHVTRPAIPDSRTAAPATPEPPKSQAPLLPEPSTPAEQPSPIAPSLPGPIHSQSDHSDWIQPDPVSQQGGEFVPIVDSRPPPPPLPPIQTSFTPIPQTSPPFGSPFGYAQGLPPGVAMNQQGLPYEMSTGRAIYYQPQPVYNPRPIMHTHMAPPGIPFVPGHMHHHSAASPDFIAPSHTPPVTGFIDPSTGTPLFSMPRQSSRIEIRAPSETSDKLSPKNPRRPSGLRTTATAFEPQQSASSDAQGRGYFPDNMPQPNGHYVSEQGVQSGHQQPMNPPTMGYPSYQQQYYYPLEGYGGYTQYVDMSQPQYEMYPSDLHANSQPVYY